jgi:diaminohydroxyphosphoribosylaminopyrimidine deaminase/5-amino-6-(5-phosphoribosylamino)uracil reductase
VNRLDRLFLERACELAERGRGNTSPNPCVGAVLVRDGRVVGEGYHHRAGLPHAEVEALRAAADARGATAYVSLEPCNHHGKTPPCSQALVDAGVSRVVIGARDPNPKAGGGMATLLANDVRVDVFEYARARALTEAFRTAVVRDRPYLALKLAASSDGFVAAQPGVRTQLTGPQWGAFVRELRIAHDAVMVGAGTVRVDDPLLTVRPPHHRLQPYRRVVVCETGTLAHDRRIFAAVEEYKRTIVLAPGAARERLAALDGVADVVFVGADDAVNLNLAQALRALRKRGFQSILCEGGPKLAAGLLGAGLVDRLYWAVAPVLLQAPDAVPALAGLDLATLQPGLKVDRREQMGNDLMMSGTFDV